MLTRIFPWVTLSCFALALSGCGNRVEPKKGKPASQETLADAAGITIYVEGMAERQNIT